MPILSTHSVQAATLYAQDYIQSRGNAAGAQAVNRSCVAALAFLVYDILLTFGQEVELIWPKQICWTKILFFFVRYFPALVQVSILFVGTELTPQFHFTPHDCFIWQVWQGVSAILVVGAVDVILVLRVYALYAENKRVLVALGVAFVLELGAMATSLALALPGIKFDAVCTVTSVPRTILIYAAASMLFQVLLFSLTAAQFVRSLRTRWRSQTPVVALLVRDGTWAFALILLVMVLQASLYALPNQKHSYAGVFYGWLLTTFSFCGYRILLNIQRLAPGYTSHRRRRRASAAEEPGPRGAARAGSSEGVGTGTGMQFTSAISVGRSGEEDEDEEMGDDSYEPAGALDQGEKVAGPSRR